jgi:serine/threonine protein kinase
MKPIPDLSHYCFNPDCRSPQNPPGTQFCQACGDRLFLAERYCAIRLLGRGTVSQTLLALDQAQTQPTLCVIKQFRPEVTRFYAPQQLQSLLRSRFEAQFELDYPTQLPRYLQQFEQDELLYVVQEYVVGENLTAVLARKGSLNANEIWQILASLLPVLQWLHNFGSIHGDIKPENLICRAPVGKEPFANLALVDAGVLLHQVAAIQPEIAIGNPAYAAPEQLAGRLEFASDLYSLGATCIHLLTGMHPFSVLDTGDRHWNWRPYWSPEAVADPKQQHLAQLLDRLIEPSLDRRIPLATIALAQIPTGYKSQKPISVPPQKPSWNCIATLTGHEGLFANINAIALSANASFLASASDDKTIRLWDLHTLKECFVLRGHTHFVRSVAFHPLDHNVLVSGSRDRTIKVWNLPNCSVVQTLTGHEQSVNVVLFNADGTLLASGSADKTVKLWQFPTSEPIATLAGHTLGVNALAFSSALGCQYLASASADTSVKLWDSTTGDLIQTLKGHTLAVRAIAFSPDGRWFATAGDDRSIRLWNTATWQCNCILSGHPWVVSSLTFSADSKTLISGSWDKTIKLWQVAAGKEIIALMGHTDSITSLAIAQNLLVSGSHDRTLKLWRCDQ